jgi:hypothetical protein
MKSTILFYYWNNRLTGSTINLFEYFLTIYQYNKDVELLIVDGDDDGIKDFIDLVYDRYNIDDLRGFESNIRTVTRYKLIREKFDNVLVLDFGTINRVKGFISPENLIVISEKKTEDPEFFFRKDLYNVTYYGEMPFHYKDKDYRMKYMFDRYKKLNKVESAIYVNSPHNDDHSFIEELSLPDKPIIFKARKHQKNLFEQFDIYVYYHANKWFDPHPRLFVECTFYEKEIMYFNPQNIIDGSYYRYNDILKNGIKDRNLTKDDEIVRQFI